MDKVIILQCSCCGRRCSGRQWWNRDKGYGICSTCVIYTLREYKKDFEELAEIQFKKDYGLDTVHYFSAHRMSEV